MKKSYLGIIIAIVVLLLTGILYRNSFNKKNNMVDKEWANVQASYQRRYDLITNLVKSVEGAANFEKKTLIEVIEARAKATQVMVDAKDLTPEKLKELDASQGDLQKAMGKLNVVIEKYPELQTNKNFLMLQTDISGTENRIKRTRENFNAAVLDYNNSVTNFPGNLFAKVLSYPARKYFEADNAAQKAPNATLNK
jgi:LemA protein